MSVPEEYKYIPAQNKTVDPPGVADALSESLSNPYGWWSTYPRPDEAPNSNLIGLKLDSSHKIVRVSSVNAYRGANINPNSKGIYPLSVNVVSFNFNNPQDFTHLAKMSVAMMIYDRYFENTWMTLQILSGNVCLALRDSNEKSVYTTIYSHSIDQKTNFSVYEPTKAEFTGTDFDWTKVKHFDIYIGMKEITGVSLLQRPNGYDIWIDSGPFFMLSGDYPFIEVYAKDQLGHMVTGKKFQVTDNQSTRTNTVESPFRQSASSGTYSIKALDTDFIQWTDGDTNPIKTITTTVNNTTTLTAVFKSGNTDGGNTDVLPILAVGGLAVAGIASWAYFSNKKGGNSNTH